VSAIAKPWVTITSIVVAVLSISTTMIMIGRSQAESTHITAKQAEEIADKAVKASERYLLERQNSLSTQMDDVKKGTSQVERKLDNLIEAVLSRK